VKKKGGKKMRRISILLIVLATLFYFPCNAKGEPITDPSQLSPNPTIIDFEQFTAGYPTTPENNPLVIGDVTFSTEGSLYIRDITDDPANGTEVESKLLDIDPDYMHLMITFLNPVSEVLLGWWDPNYPGNFLRAYDVNNQLLEEVELTDLGPPHGVHATWIGFKRPSADISRIEVDPAIDPPYDNYGIDNIYYNTATPIFIDIKPGSCPNPFNLKSRGVLPVAILGTAEFDVTTIDRASIKLQMDSQEVAPIRSSLEDVATPFIGEITSCESCAESGPDGYMDLTLKFKTQAIVQAMGVENVNDGDCFILTLIGKLYDGTPIVGEDVLRILKKGRGRFPNF